MIVLSEKRVGNILATNVNNARGEYRKLLFAHERNEAQRCTQELIHMSTFAQLELAVNITITYTNLGHARAAVLRPAGALDRSNKERFHE